MRFVTGADRTVLWVTLAYAREYVIQHYAYAPVSKRDPRELSRYSKKFGLPGKANATSQTVFLPHVIGIDFCAKQGFAIDIDFKGPENWDFFL